MFNDLKKDQNEDQVDDIFAESDQSEDAVKAPRSSLSDYDLKTPTAKTETNDWSENDRPAKSGKILKTIFLVVIILLIVLVAAYFVYAKILLPKTLNSNVNTVDNSLNTVSNQSDVLDNQADMDDEKNDLIEDNQEDLATSSDDGLGNLEVLKNVDSDLDGLSDYDELYIHYTDPYVLDSDSDLISDYDEIMIFGTNPNLSDSDSDGYSDGQEIMSAYNPLGEGRIDLSSIKDLELLAERYPDLAGTNL